MLTLDTSIKLILFLQFTPNIYLHLFAMLLYLNTTVNLAITDKFGSYTTQVECITKRSALRSVRDTKVIGVKEFLTGHKLFICKVIIAYRKENQNWALAS